MYNAHFEFLISPYILFLIIPLILLIILAFFIFNRKSHFHSSLNQILSAIIECIIIILCVVCLSGPIYAYEVKNQQNELVILLDQSYSFENIYEETNTYVHDILTNNKNRSKIAVVLFSYNQETILPLDYYNDEEAYKTFLIAREHNNIDNRATNIASALNYVYDVKTSKGIITNPQSAKILLISDGLETDGDALSVCKNIINAGIQIDTSFFASSQKNDISILDVTFPDNIIHQEDEFNFLLNIKSSRQIETKIELQDENENGEIKTNIFNNVSIKLGVQNIKIPYSFLDFGTHKLSFKISSENVLDTIKENNLYFTFYDVLKNNKLLILETYLNEASKLESQLNANLKNESYKITRSLISDVQDMTLDELAIYSEIILYNIVQKDMTKEFQENIYSYCHELGGGIFTVGGFEKDENNQIQMRPKERDENTLVPIAHSYQQDDMADSLYGSMLPVTFEKYSPAIGVVFVIDVSGSMSTVTNAPIHAAIRDAKESLNLLSKRDYVGVMVLEKDYEQISDSMISMTQRERIEEALDKAEATTNEATAYRPALIHAIDMLKTCPSDISIKHIVLLSDGGPGDKYSDYAPPIEEAHKNYGITITIMTYYKSVEYFDGDFDTPYYYNHSYTVKGAQINKDNLDNLAKLGAGSSIFVKRDGETNLKKYLYNDLHLDELKEEMGMQSYNPKVASSAQIMEGITNSEIESLTLGGFFPSKKKINADIKVALTANASPLYAEWDFGNGKVGSLMLDLEGYWSNELFNNKSGLKLLDNIIKNLTLKVENPIEKLKIDLVEENLTTQVNIFGFDAKQELNNKLVALLYQPNNLEVKKFDLSTLSLTSNRFSFENIVPGTYTIIVLKVNKQFNIMDSNIKSLNDIQENEILDKSISYRTFSYSKEYLDEDAYKNGQNLLLNLSTRPMQDDIIYSKFIYTVDDIFLSYFNKKVVINPRNSLMLTALILFIIDIIIRKFHIFKFHKK